MFRRYMQSTGKPVRFFLLWCLTNLFFISLSQGWIPLAHAQLPNFQDLTDQSNQQPRISYIQRGNIHIADVRLDGVPLFPVAADAAGDSSQNRRSLNQRSSPSSTQDPLPDSLPSELPESAPSSAETNEVLRSFI